MIRLSYLMDRAVVWNIRGLNEPTKKFAIKSLINKNNISFMSILVTRVRKVNKEKIMSSFLNWPCLDNYAATDGGRIWVLWNP